MEKTKPKKTHEALAKWGTVGACFVLAIFCVSNGIEHGAGEFVAGALVRALA